MRPELAWHILDEVAILDAQLLRELATDPANPAPDLVVLVKVDAEDCNLTACVSHLSAARFRSRDVDRPTPQHDAIRRARLSPTHIAGLDVVQHALGLALERIAPARAAARPDEEYVVIVEREPAGFRRDPTRDELLPVSDDRETVEGAGGSAGHSELGDDRPFTDQIEVAALGRGDAYRPLAPEAAAPIPRPARVET